MDMITKLKVRKYFALLLNGVHGEELSKLEELWTKANLPEEGGKWRKIGFTTDAPKWKFNEQHNRPAERSCPFAKTSIEAELLCDYWDVSTEYITLWNEIEAMVDDFPKVSALVRSQLKFALRDEAIKQLYEFEKDMLEVEYKVIRDRKLKELELDDDLLSKPQ
uniref:Uncharacterized protein n=2 Tax=Rhizophagus irregularis TaxID=588596 RepID=U9SWR1_RHIID